MAKLEHVGIAVHDSMAVRRLFEELLDIQSYKDEEVAADRVRTDFLNGGCVKLELLEGLDATSPISKFIEKRGVGLHHLAFEVDDLNLAFARAKDLGYTPIEDAPRIGADGKQIFFLHPRETAGILIEVCETHRSILHPAGEKGRIKIRRTVSANGPIAAHLHDAETSLNPDALAHRLETRLSLVDIDAPTDVVVSELRGVLGHEPLHLIASGRMASFALAYAAAHAADVQTLSLMHPQDAILESACTLPTFILSRDDQRLEAVLRLRDSLPLSRLAVLPELDVDIAARLVARHIETNSVRP